MGVARELKFAMLKYPFWPPGLGPEGDPPGPEIRSIIDKLEIDQLVTLCNVRLKYRQEMQQLQLKFNHEALKLQEKFQKEFMDVLG